LLNIRRDAEPWQRDFRKFLFLVWQHLGYGEPTKLQYDVSKYLQDCVTGTPTGISRDMLQAFRGMGKSYLSVSLTVWCLANDPQWKILVVSASEQKATDFTTFCLQLINSMEVLAFLRPDKNQRQSSTRFDVGPATNAKDSSVTSYGITGQITGSRAHMIIADDVEVPKNSATPTQREKLLENIKEFDNIILPGGSVVYLGTPQSFYSIYNGLPSKGYRIRVYPARVPDLKQAVFYGARLAPYVRSMMAKGLAGEPVEPERFTKEDLLLREQSIGASTFQLQFMLNTTLSDANKFPLKIKNLSVMSLDTQRGPEVLTWGADPSGEIKDLPVLGLTAADRLYKPIMVGERYTSYSRIIATLDPSGRGADETAIAIVAELHGRMFLLWVEGWTDGFSNETLDAIAALCVRFEVQELYVEPNFGGGTFASLVRPAVARAWDRTRRGRNREGLGTSVVDLKPSSGQKEIRISRALEPVLAAHRLVVDSDCLRADAAVLEAPRASSTYSLIYQMSHLTLDRGALDHDDRLDALAMAVEVLAAGAAVDPDEMHDLMEEVRAEEWIMRLAEEDAGDWGEDRRIDLALSPSRKDGRVGSQREQALGTTGKPKDGLRRWGR